MSSFGPLNTIPMPKFKVIEVNLEAPQAFKISGHKIEKRTLILKPYTTTLTLDME